MEGTGQLLAAAAPGRQGLSHHSGAPGRAAAFSLWAAAVFNPCQLRTAGLQPAAARLWPAAAAVLGRTSAASPWAVALLVCEIGGARLCPAAALPLSEAQLGHGQQQHHRGQVLRCSCRHVAQRSSLHSSSYSMLLSPLRCTTSSSSMHRQAKAAVAMHLLLLLSWQPPALPER